MKIRSFIVIIITLLTIIPVSAQKTDYPLIGAQVFIEPGQSDEDIDGFFSILRDSNMEVARIRMFGCHMMRPDGSVDFTLYDKAFDAAEKYGIKLFATLFPPTDELNDVGGFKFPRSKKHLEQVDRYLEAVVSHFSTKPALYTWVLQNEPGNGPGKISRNDLSGQVRREWEQTHKPYERPEGYLAADFDEIEFTRYYMVWFMNHIAEKVAEYDKVGHYTHINPHALMENVHTYDFPSLEKSITSLGLSMHFSWHFGYFPDEEFTDGVSIMCDVIRSNAGNNPFWVTEMQGGNVTASGYRLLCPTAEQTSQWLLTSIASGCEGVIFWTLNARRAAMEAGEWALLDFKNQPSDRLKAASSVASLIKDNKALFAEAQPYEGPYAVLYNLESLLIQGKASMGYDKLPGRDKGAVMRSVISAYEALQATGKQGNVYDMDRFEWSVDKHPVAILPNSVCIPERFHSAMREYVQNGGHLIVTGLGGFYDEQMRCAFMGGHPLADLFGADLLEYKVVDDYFDVNINGRTVPSHIWRGVLACNDARSMSVTGSDVTACRHLCGKGIVDFIPTPVELGGDCLGLGALYASLTPEVHDDAAIVSYADPCINVKVMTSSGKTIYVMTNTSSEAKSLKLAKGLDKSLSLKYGGATIKPGSVRLEPHGYAVLIK